MIKRIIKIWNMLEEIILAYSILILAILIFINVFARLFSFQALFWLEELSRYTLILATFLGASVVTKIDGHANMTMIYSALPARGVSILKGITHLISFGVSLLMDYFAWEHVLRLAKIGVKTSTLTFPIYIAYLPIAIFLIFIAGRFLILALKNFRDVNKKDTGPEEMNLEKGSITP
jgi:C4-dicarboxylate transporter, DctQ subunit